MTINIINFNSLYHESKHCKLYLGDALAVLKTLPTGSVDLIVTSPPYFQQRNYEVDGQIGMEAAFDEYETKLLEVLAECKRILKDSGGLYLVLDDTHNGAKRGNTNGQTEHGSTIGEKAGFLKTQKGFFKPKQKGIRDQSLIGIPWDIANRMVREQGGGWCWRSTIAWIKPNPAPESATSRPTDGWEPVFFFVKDENKAYYDMQYVPFATDDKDLKKYLKKEMGRYGGDKYNDTGIPTLSSGNAFTPQIFLGAHPLNVWVIPQSGFDGEHYATFPPELPRRAIKSSCPRYICNKCGHARIMQYAKEIKIDTRPGLNTCTGKSGSLTDPNASLHNSELSTKRQRTIRRPIGLSDCYHNAGWHAGVVLDPFAGVCMTGAAAMELGMDFVGIDISEEYCKVAVSKVLDKFIKQERLFEE